MTDVSETAVWALLEEVTDPEIPTVSVVDLGMVRDVRVLDTEIVVELMPTFLGCPALDLIRSNIAVRLAQLGPVRVDLVRDQAWSTDRITDRGRASLLASGFAPPRFEATIDVVDLARASCPHCASENTTLESAFGPTPCRAIHYCRGCRQPFEQFKAV
jgi:ring-1,2-phenylacetyl-CoA epoxidase subunit PaaD